MRGTQTSIGSLKMDAASQSTAEMKKKKELENVTERINKFTLELFKALTKGKLNDNLVVSPICAELPLALTYLGAGGNTAEQMLKVLNLNPNRTDLLEGHRDLIKSMEKPVIKVATKIFLEQTFSIKQEFLDTAKEYFLSSVDKVDFRKDHEHARKTINAWVEKKTVNKIKDLISSGMLNPDTSLVIVNAMHFKDKWQNKFSHYKTSKQPFYLSPTKSVEVDMMKIEEYFRFMRDTRTKTKILELPYMEPGFSMVIFLPDAVDGLQKLVETISETFSIEKYKSGSEVCRISVELPKFKIEQIIPMNNLLKEMGMVDMFEDTHADFSGISDAKRLKVSDVVQKVFIDVNEEGTEAAAATGMAFEFTCAPPRAMTTFKADHPFVFTLMKESTVLFVGCVTKF